MKATLESEATAAGRHPDLVIAGHVHNYQRLTKTMADESQIPYLVTGAGGYHNLHSMIKVNVQRLVAPVQFTDQSGDVVTLDSYVDDRFGFLRLEVDESSFSGKYFPANILRSRARKSHLARAASLWIFTNTIGRQMLRPKRLGSRLVDRN